MSSRQISGTFRLFLFLSLLALVVGCSSSSSGGASSPSGKAITAFGFTAEENPQLGGDITGTIDEANSTILLAGPLEEGDVAALKASFTTTGKEVSVGEAVQESGVTENDFAGPLTYRVTAEDGTTRDYLVHAAYWKHPSDTDDGISPDEFATEPQVAMDGSGNAVIVWRQNNNDSHFTHIFMSEYRDGTWIGPEGMADYINLDVGYPDPPQVAMDNNGNAVIVWNQSGGVFKSECRDGIWTELAERISQAGRNAIYPQVAMDDSGNAVIVWWEYDVSSTTSDQILACEYRNGVWTDPESISPNAGDAIYPQVAMDNNGNAVIVWLQKDGEGKWQICMSENRNGTWTSPEELAGDITDTSHTIFGCPQVAMDNNGNAVIVWRQQDGEDKWQIYMIEYRDGTWSTEPTIISPEDGDVRNPQVAMDDSGNAVIAWGQYAGSSVRGYKIFKIEYRDGAWTHPNIDEFICLDEGPAHYPQVAMDGSGSAVIAWHQNAGGFDRIFKSEYRFWDLEE